MAELRGIGTGSALRRYATLRSERSRTRFRPPKRPGGEDPEVHTPLSTSSFYSRSARSAMKYPPPMHNFSILAELLLLAATSTAAPRGFLPDTAAAQTRWEEQYVASPDASVIRD